MATIFYSINNGQNEYQATVAAVTASKDVEIVVNSTTNIPTREELLLAVEKLTNFIVRQPYQPL
jgi:hypothetical protein